MLRRMREAWGAFGAPVMRDAGGAAAIFFAVGIVPLIGGVGLAVDGALGHLLRNRMVRSLDAAGLAAAQADLSEAQKVARALFDANFGIDGSGAAPEETRVTLTEFTVTPDASGERLILTARAETPTVFMRLFGRKTMAVSARSVVRRNTSGMELALVMDSTGSMVGSKIEAMRRAADALVETVFAGQETRENLWVSVVPYTATVNIGPSRTGWLVPEHEAFVKKLEDYRKANPGQVDGELRWKGCVEARAAPEDGLDRPPSAMRFEAFVYASTERAQDNKWPPIVANVEARNDGRGPNLGCATPITPLTASRAKVKAAIAELDAWHRGGTTGNLGLAWGWRTLSPRWRGVWGGDTPAALPLDYGKPYMKKTVVILTDGNNQFYDHDTAAGTPGSDYTAYGRLEELGATTLSQGRRILDARMAGTCRAMKKEGIEIYAIIFGPSPDAQTQDLYRTCATSPTMYYRATDEAALYAAFDAIAARLSNLRIEE